VPRRLGGLLSTNGVERTFAARGRWLGCGFTFGGAAAAGALAAGAAFGRGPSTTIK